MLSIIIDCYRKRLLSFYKLIIDTMLSVWFFNHHHAIGSSRQRWNEWTCKNILKRQKTKWDELSALTR